MNKRPTAEHIQKLAESYRTEWAQQSALDEALLSYLMLTNKQEVNKAQPISNGVKGFRSGIGYAITKQDADLLTITPGLVVNPITENPADKEHSSKLENWLSGAWKQSQMGGMVWSRAPQDLVGLGRFWDNLYPSPKVWGSSRYEKLLEALTDAGDDPEKMKEAKEDIALWKRDHWPIRWRYVAPRQTWTTFNGETWLPEVVEIRKMTRKQIEAEYPDKMPKDQMGKTSDTTTIDVYEYANHEWCAVVIAGQTPENAEIATDYQHSMGMNPYGLCEAMVLPDNDLGLRWSGTLFAARQMIDVHDELLAEFRENIRDNTKGQYIQRFDPEHYDEDAKVTGRPKVEKIEPGGPPIAMWTTEEIGLTPTMEINREAPALLDRCRDLIYTTKLSPALRGEAKSGTSQNQYVTQIQIAERATDPYLKGMGSHAEYTAKRMFRSVQTLDEEVAVFAEKGLVSVGPKDVRGWENAVNARLDRAIPIDRNLVIQQASVELSALGLSRETVYEGTLGYADPLTEIRKGETDILRKATFEQAVIPQTVQIAQGKLATPTPEQYDALAALFQTASPDLKAMIGQAAMGDPELAGRIEQGMANVGRTGVPQQQRGPTQPVSPLPANNGY